MMEGKGRGDVKEGKGRGGVREGEGRGEVVGPSTLGSTSTTQTFF